MKLGLEKKNQKNLPPELNSILDQLRKAGIKVTEPRIAILQSLFNQHGPFTAEELHSQITKKICDLATIYRSLTSLEKTGFIKRCEFGDGSARYELSPKLAKNHHHHVICKLCKRIEVLDDCELSRIDQFAKKKGFTEVSHSLEFFGICPSCVSTVL